MDLRIYHHAVIGPILYSTSMSRCLGESNVKNPGYLVNLDIYKTLVHATGVKRTLPRDNHGGFGTLKFSAKGTAEA